MSHSIVSRTAIIASLLTGGATIVLAGIVIETQQNLLERRIASQVELELDRVSSVARSFPLEMSPGSRERWQELLDEVARLPNVVSAHVFVARDRTVLKRDGVAQAVDGTAGAGPALIWDESLRQSSPDSRAISIQASTALVQSLQTEINDAFAPSSNVLRPLVAYDRLRVLAKPLGCVGPKGPCNEIRVLVSMQAADAPLAQLRHSLIFAAFAIPLLVSLTVYLVVRANLKPFRAIASAMAGCP